MIQAFLVFLRIANNQSERPNLQSALLCEENFRKDLFCIVCAHLKVHLFEMHL